MRLRRITEHMRTHNWTAVFIDFVIVVAGVFVGVQVDSWWDGRSNARKERAYLLELKEDFAQVITELEGDSKEYAMIAVAMTTLLQQSRGEAPTLSVAELNWNAGRLIYMVGTPIVADTYTNLTGSGELASGLYRLVLKSTGVTDGAGNRLDGDDSRVHCGLKQMLCIRNRTKFAHRSPSPRRRIFMRRAAS